MKYIIKAAVGLLLLALATSVSAHTEMDIVIRDIWARATVNPETMGSGEMMMATPEAEATEAMGAMSGHSGMDTGHQMAGMSDPMMVDVSAVYFTLDNPGNHPIRLSAASTPVAGAVEIHETTMENNIMRMRPLEDGITVAPGETAVLEPGGLHIMLLDLNTPLVDGSAIPLTLMFDMLNDAGEVDGEPITVLTAAPVLLTAPEPAPFYISGGWARPTAMGDDMHEHGSEHGSDAHGEHDHAESTPAPEMDNAGPDVSAGYFTIVNIGASDDTLIAASTPAATETQLHTMIMEGDIMRMRELEGGAPIPAGGSAVFEPGANHIMLIGLTEPLVEGTAIPLTLTFASGLEMTVALPVIDRALSETMHSH